MFFVLFCSRTIDVCTRNPSRSHPNLELKKTLGLFTVVIYDQTCFPPARTSHPTPTVPHPCTCSSPDTRVHTDTPGPDPHSTSLPLSFTPDVSGPLSVSSLLRPLSPTTPRQYRPSANRPVFRVILLLSVGRPNRTLSERFRARLRARQGRVVRYVCLVLRPT